MKQRTIVFDFGGVLFNTSATDFYRERFQAQGRTEADLDYFLKFVFTKADRSQANTGTMQAVITQKIAQHPEWEGDIRAFGADKNFIKQVRSVIPGMQNVINDIVANGDRVVGLTNWASDTYDVMPRAFPDILSRFNEVVVSGKVQVKKPAPEIFRIAHSAFGSPNPSETYYFDDKAANVAAAQKSVGWNAFTFVDANTVREALVLSPEAG